MKTPAADPHTEGGAGLALLGKGFAIMEAVAQARRPPSLSDISRQTGLPTSTVHRILGVLCVQGVVDREEDGYRPGWRSAQLFDPRLAPHWQSLRDSALPSMTGLHAALGCSVSLTAPTRRGTAILLRLRASGDRAAPGSYTNDAALHQLSAARLLDAYRDEPYSRAPDLPPAERARIRATGHIQLRGADSRLPVSSLAVPVLDRFHHPIAALTVCGRWSGDEVQAVLHRLRSAGSQTARALRADLGAHAA
jgi:DNA-binding IclR family transcriptional regulator